MATTDPMTFNLRGLEPWAGLQVESGPADVVISGIRYDRAATYRAGAAQAPDRLRQISALFPPVSDSGVSLSGLRLLDLGDLEVATDMEREWSALADSLASRAGSESVMVTLGGDHSVAIPSVVAQRRRREGEIAILYVDAHPDLCDTSRGSGFTHGCALRRGIEEAPVRPDLVTVIGCRDFDLEEIEYAERSGLQLITMEQVEAGGLEGAMARVRERVPAGAGLHVSFDIDSLDPAFAPGTTLPAPGGFTTRQAMHLLDGLQGMNLIGLDLVEVCPPADPGDLTSLVACKLIFKFLSLLTQG